MINGRLCALAGVVECRLHEGYGGIGDQGPRHFAQLHGLAKKESLYLPFDPHPSSASMKRGAMFGVQLRTPLSARPPSTQDHGRSFAQFVHRKLPYSLPSLDEHGFVTGAVLEVGVRHGAFDRVDMGELCDMLIPQA
jgi:hypothetical protein